jgi:large subunit ribosomal protein L23
MNKDKLATTLLAPLVTEKAALVGESSNQYAFRVAPRATKPEIKQAVEHMFKVQVATVNVVNVQGKSKLFRQRPGKRRDWKKAYVRLVTGQEINFAGGEK